MADVDHVDETDRNQASEKSLKRMWKFVNNFVEKSGSYLHPERDITEFLVIGLAKHVDESVPWAPSCPSIP